MTWCGEEKRHRDVQGKGALNSTLRAPLQTNNQFSGILYHGTRGKDLKLNDLKPYIHQEGAGRGISFTTDISIVHQYLDRKQKPIVAKVYNLNLYKFTTEELIFRKILPERAEELGLLRKDGKPISPKNLKEFGYDGINFGNLAEGHLAVNTYYEYLKKPFGYVFPSGFKRDELTGLPHAESEVFIFDTSLDKIKEQNREENL